MIAVYKEDFLSGCLSYLNDENNYHYTQNWRALFQAFSSHRQPSASLNKGIQQLDKLLGQTGKTIMACTVAEGF